MTVKEAAEMGLSIIGLMKDPNDLWNPPKAEPVTIIIMGNSKDVA